ncbi:DUF4391 domain-containing protein [Pseudoalteromonas agarivorans]|uniref:DUF4391 domain-containing protein n=1 Tax=Pseudoalteromonas agarivorans TaxID=176102 RepID=A0AAD0XBY0_9GAMM|nr:DUF4391 domain-containing protein [Pseudoalteromonas agarivorans]AYM86861.1 DUF4391 domain-containing protein [Pseudoalteromonas agarivorans]
MNQNSLLTELIVNLKLPNETKLGVKIPKKTLSDNTELSSNDKSIIKDVLKSIDWAYTLKPETINIPTFEDGVREYLEIAILQVQVKSLNKTKQLCKLLHTNIPYPTLLLVEHEQSLAISVADKRINQADSHKLTIEKQFDSPWLNQPLESVQQSFINDFSLSNCSTVSLYDLYSDFINKFNRLESANFTGVYGSHQQTSDSQQVTETLEQLKSLETELNGLRNKLKTENLMNNKVKLNVQARAIKKQIKQLKEQL